MFKLITRWVIVVAALGLAAYDVVAYAYGGVGATESRVIYYFARENPIAPFAFGVLCGHLFWPQQPRPKKEALDAG